jgi:hypothetical protein
VKTAAAAAAAASDVDQDGLHLGVTGQDLEGLNDL